MSQSSDNARRKFLKKLSGTAAALATGPAALAASPSKTFHILKRRGPVPANDRITIAGIGMGIMGFGDVNAALTQPGIELISVADCYQGHLTRAKEVYGDQVKTTMNYQEILDDPDIDAVIIATPDHWHDRMAIQAMQKGKAVYCEKPMVQYVQEGPAVIETQKKTNKAFQVGSQFASSLAHRKAKEFYEAGEIGQLMIAEAFFDRYDALGAWQYSIPPDASAETCDWTMFQGDASDLPFSAERFFHWRNYRDYGTGIPGDLFVHLFTMLHTITGAIGPERIYATGGLRYWEDGRDVADVMMGLYDYPKSENHPAFNLGLRVNFVDGSGGRTGIRLVGSEGEMDIGWNSVTVRRNKLPKAPGYGGWDTFDTFPEAMQKEFEKEYKKKYADVMNEKFKATEETYTPPEEYGGEGMRKDHFADFFNAMRTGEETVEGPVFGLRAAGPALASNTSHYEKRVVYWDPQNMQEVTDEKAMGKRE